MKSGNYAIVAAIAALLIVTTATVSIATPENVFAYNRNQATSQTSACGNNQEPENIGCQNIDSSIQGDENAVNIIGQQQFPTPSILEPPTTAKLTVVKNVECEPVGQCPNLPDPSEFTILVTDENGDQISFEGSAEGTPVTLEPGGYSVSEVFSDTSPVPDPDGLELTSLIPSAGCNSGQSGPIQAGEERTCTWTNTYEPESPTSSILTVVKNN
jgi:hypothetical protein